MYLSRSGLLDPEADCAPFLGRAEDVEAMLASPLVDANGGRMLWSAANEGVPTRTHLNRRIPTNHSIYLEKSMN